MGINQYVMCKVEFLILAVASQTHVATYLEQI